MKLPFFKRFLGFKGRTKNYLSTSFWLLFERVFRISLNLFVGVWLARFLGPSDFGLLNLAVAFVTILFPIAHFGIHGILVKELYLYPESRDEILGSVFSLKLTLSIFLIVCVSILAQFNVFGEQEVNTAILLASGALLFQPFLVLESWTESISDTRLASIFKSAFFFLVSALKVLAIFTKQDVLIFLAIYSLEAMMVALGLVFTYSVKGYQILDWRVSFKRILSLGRKSWLLVFSGLSAILYLKIDQIMLGYMVSEKELGYYSAAVRLSEAWYFIPIVLSNAIFPAIISAKKTSELEYTERLQLLSDLYLLAALALSILTTIFSGYIINTLFGGEYGASSIILQVHIWASLFIFLRTILSKWLIAEDEYKYSLISQAAGAISNIILNIILIPKFLGLGAAISTVLSYSISAIFILVPFQKTKELLFIFLKSFTAPFRIRSIYEKVIEKTVA